MALLILDSQKLGSPSKKKKKLRLHENAISSLPACGKFHLLMIFANSLDPDQARHNRA